METNRMGIFSKPDKYKEYEVDYQWLIDKSNQWQNAQGNWNGLNITRANYWRQQAERIGKGGTATITNTPTEQSGTWSVYQNPADMYSAMFEGMAGAMEEQARAQADYMAQMQALQADQARQQEEAAKLANVESTKTAADFIQTNAADTARKQALRRGLMSTFTRYPGATFSKSDKLGG